MTEALPTRLPASGSAASTRVAAVDCGTNSVRLLVAELPGDGELRELARDMRITRLGQGVDRTGRLDPAAVERTLAALRGYAEDIRRLGAERVRMVATSASRDAANRDLFVTGVHEVLGVEPEVITGDEEARLSYLGATAELRAAGDDAPPGPYLVVDIGGGSTEFVLGTDEVEAARSVDVGCVRMTERHLRDDPPTAEQVEAAVRDVDAAIALAAETVPLDSARTLVGLAGSVTTVAGIALGLPAYDSVAIHGSRIPRRQVAEVTARLLAMTRQERAALPVMHPGRVDVIGAGALVLDRVMARVGAAEVLVSEHDILDGIALSLRPGASGG
jgi:exopolyphosphatase/guanosine-5'-triphosphate,3'-diphosphate pyrophosphatase